MTPNTQTGTICATVDVDGDAAHAVIYKNGAALKGGAYSAGEGDVDSISNCVAILEMNGSSDFIEGFVYSPTTTSHTYK